jgi:hypothetical protein
MFDEKSNASASRVRPTVTGAFEPLTLKLGITRTVIWIAALDWTPICPFAAGAALPP